MDIDKMFELKLKGEGEGDKQENNICMLSSLTSTNQPIFSGVWGLMQCRSWRGWEGGDGSRRWGMRRRRRRQEEKVVGRGWG